jgi:hypothetical protein
MTRTVVATLAAHERWSRLDPAARVAATAPGRKAAAERFEQRARALHPDASDKFISKVVANLKAAHYRRMALASAAARRGRHQPAAVRPQPPTPRVDLVDDEVENPLW